MLTEKMKNLFNSYFKGNTFSQEEITTNILKISNEIYSIGHDAILDREAEITVKKRKLNDSQLDNLVAKIIKVG